MTVRLIEIDEPMTRPQAEMYGMEQLSVTFPLFVAGYGAGKTEVLIKCVARDVMLFAGVKIGVYAPTYDLLSLNIVPRLEAWLDKIGVGHAYNKNDHIMTVGSGKVIFRSMDNPGRIVAYEVYRSHVDEADLMTTVTKGGEAWRRIIARNRQPHPQERLHFNMCSAYSTPEGYKFTYHRWQKNKSDGYEYVQAPTWSNPYLPDNYIDDIARSYTPEQLKAYLAGKWTNIFSGSVYSYYDRDRHDTDRVIVPGDKLIIGADFNYGGSCCKTYVPYSEAEKIRKSKKLQDKLIKKCKDSGASPKVEMSRLASKFIGLQMVDEFISVDTREMVETAKRRYRGHDITFYPDSTGDKSSTNARKSDIAMLRGGGFDVKAKPTNPFVVDRINAMQRMLYNKNLLVNKDRCPDASTALEEHAFNPTTNTPEKFSKPGSTDDHNDAAGYPVAYLYPIKPGKTTTTAEVLL